MPVHSVETPLSRPWQASWGPLSTFLSLAEMVCCARPFPQRLPYVTNIIVREPRGSTIMDFGKSI
jgi:hypothetical protein